MKDSPQRSAYENRQQLRKHATDFAAACLLGDAAVIAEAFRKLEEFADGYRKDPVVPEVTYPDRQDRPRKAAAGNVDGLYRSLTPRQRYLGATNPLHDEFCRVVGGRTAEEVAAVIEKCKGWLAAGPNLKTIKTKEES